MSDLMETIKSLKRTFDTYAEKDGQKDTISKSDVAEVFRTKFDIVSRNDVAQFQQRAVNASLTYF